MNLFPIKKNMSELVFSGDLKILVSYSTPVAIKYKGVFYVTDKFFSATTRRHINEWTDKAETIEKSQALFNRLMLKTDEMNLDKELAP